MKKTSEKVVERKGTYVKSWKWADPIMLKAKHCTLVDKAVSNGVWANNADKAIIYILK